MRLLLCQQLLPQFSSTVPVVLERSVPFPFLDSLRGRIIILMLFLLAPPVFQEFLLWEARFKQVILRVRQWVHLAAHSTRLEPAYNPFQHLTFHQPVSIGSLTAFAIK